MLGGRLEKAILFIVLIVAAVGIVGLFASYDFAAPADAITGNVIASNVDCDSCSGYAPVCGKINHHYRTYDNACEATCNGAKIAAAYPCQAISQA